MPLIMVYFSNLVLFSCFESRPWKLQRVDEQLGGDSSGDSANFVVDVDERLQLLSHPSRRRLWELLKEHIRGGNEKLAHNSCL